MYLVSFIDVLSYIGYILLAILVLLTMITVHELGHYLVGKAFKFKINEFAIGFGSKIFQRRKKDGELFSIRALPLGGYCAFLGEDEETVHPQAFNNKNPWQRIAVLISGALMNYIFALVLICTMFGIYGRTALIVVDLTPSAEISSENIFMPNDVIISANGKNVYLTTDLMGVIENKEQGEFIDFIVNRKGENTLVKIALRKDTFFQNVEDNEGLYDALGFSYKIDENGEMSHSGVYLTSIRLGFFDTIRCGFEYSIRLAGTIFIVLGQLLTGKLGFNAMGGTISTITITADAIRVGGFRYLLNMASFIGVNLSVFNLLPIPALDGSRVVFTLIEGISKKRVPKKVEGIIHGVGLVALMLFAVLADLQRCF